MSYSYFKFSLQKPIGSGKRDSRSDLFSFNFSNKKKGLNSTTKRKSTVKAGPEFSNENTKIETPVRSTTSSISIGSSGSRPALRASTISNENDTSSSGNVTPRSSQSQEDGNYDVQIILEKQPVVRLTRLPQIKQEVEEPEDCEPHPSPLVSISAHEIIDEAQSDSDNDTVTDGIVNKTISVSPPENGSGTNADTNARSPIINVSPSSKEVCTNRKRVYSMKIATDEKLYKKLKNSHITKNEMIVADDAVDYNLSYLTLSQATFGQERVGVNGVDISVADAGDDLHVGYLTIEPKTVRPTDCVRDTKMIYWIISGSVIVRSAGAAYLNPEHQCNYLVGKTLTHGDCFVVPANACHTIENWTGEPAKLSFCMKRVNA